MTQKEQEQVRGCGTRSEDGLYLVSNLSPFGRPLEEFLIDPVVPWKGSHLRAPMLQSSKDGVNHVIIGVGVEYYPYIPDLVEEARIMGVSKRVPRDFDISKLSAKSRMILMHPRGIPTFTHMALVRCPKAKTEQHECIGSLWPLSTVRSYRKLHEVQQDDGSAIITTPSTTYRTTMMTPPSKGGTYNLGLFLMVPITQLEYVSRSGKLPERLAQKAKIPLQVVNK